MENEEIGLILQAQKKYFATGITLDPSFRIEILRKLRSLIILHEKELIAALWNDFHKPEFEVIGTESRFVVSEINFLERNIKKWSGPRRVPTQLMNFLSSSYVAPQPYGQVLILSPWNFPFQLAFMPLAGAIAAGNCVVLKASQQVPATTAVMQKILGQFPSELVAMIDGDHYVSKYLLEHRFDYIFFTGSTNVGKHVMSKAAANLTPVSLELGGKNPCVVAADARLGYAAKRIAWGKFINGGQVCVCPDYLLIDRKVSDKFLELITEEIRSFYGTDPSASPDFARVINGKCVHRLSELMKCGDIVTGGITDELSGYVSPTIIRNVKPGDRIMQEEIFGPVLPVIEFTDFSEVYHIIEQNPMPLAVYIFSEDRTLVKDFLRKTRSGTAAVNDTVMQILSQYLPFGGIGSSGIGRYHGRKSFETFSNMRSVLVKSNLLDIWLRYPPYKKYKTRIVSWILS
jgi:aldehyde dehydrogenase (NAD+)